MLSVVVPAFNEEKVLPRSLAAIRTALAAFDDAELIVCDNNSTDRTAAIAREAGAQVAYTRRLPRSPDDARTALAGCYRPRTNEQVSGGRETGPA